MAGVNNRHQKLEQQVCLLNVLLQKKLRFFFQKRFNLQLSGYNHSTTVSFKLD